MSSRRGVLWAVLLCGALLLGCATTQTRGGSAKTVSQPSRDLELGEWKEGRLECSAGACRQVYPIRISQAGTLAIDVYAPTGRGLPDFEATILAADGSVLLRSTPTGRSPRKIRQPVGAGAYEVQISAARKTDGVLGYELQARLESGSGRTEPRKPPQRPPPAPVARADPEPSRPVSEEPAEPDLAPGPPDPGPDPFLTVEVLDVEKSGEDVDAILIDAGTVQGVEEGMSAELRENGEIIAHVQVIEVYERGSRGQLVSPLRAEITFDTKVRFPSIPTAEQ